MSARIQSTCIQSTCIKSTPTDQRSATLTTPLIVLFATAIGVIVVNLFAPQTLVGLIGPSLGFDAAASGLIAMATLSAMPPACSCWCRWRTVSKTAGSWSGCSGAP
jgi:hypothetical protein